MVVVNYEFALSTISMPGFPTNHVERLSPPDLRSGWRLVRATPYVLNESETVLYGTQYDLNNNPQLMQSGASRSPTYCILCVWERYVSDPDRPEPLNEVVRDLVGSM
jgi:hypothetical protein